MSDRRALHVVEGCQAPAYATRDEWLAAGARFVETQSTASWAFADWLKAGVEAWGESVTREAAESSGNSPEKIRHYLVAATAYPPRRRRRGLTFTHHLEVARLAPDVADGLLDRADAEGWSARQTREAAREASILGENERLRRENAALKRQVKGKRIDPRAFAKQVRGTLGEKRRAMRGEDQRAAAFVGAVAESEALEGLHGNARRALARDLRRFANERADDTEALMDIAVNVADTIEGKPA